MVGYEGRGVMAGWSGVRVGWWGGDGRMVRCEGRMVGV